MPFYTSDIQGDGTGAAASTAITCGEGNILSACAFVKDGSTVSGNTQIEIALSASPGSTDKKTAILVSDYVFDTYSPGWDGNVPVQQGEGAVITLRSFDTATIRVVFKYEQHPV